MRVAAMLLAMVLVAGCSSPEEPAPSEDPEPTETQDPFSNATLEPVTNATRPTPAANLTLGPGNWNLAVDGSGLRAFRLTLEQDMAHSGYSFGGTVRILIVPVDHRIEACEPSSIYLLATGVPDFTSTDDDLPAGDYDVIVAGDGSGNIQWRIGSSDEDRSGTFPASSTDWTLEEFEPSVDGSFEVELPAGYGYAAFSASTAPLRNDDRVHHQVANATDGTVCHEAETEQGSGLLGNGPRASFHFESPNATMWTGIHEGSGNVDGDTTYRAQTIIFAPPTS